MFQIKVLGKTIIFFKWNPMNIFSSRLNQNSTKFLWCTHISKGNLLMKIYSYESIFKKVFLGCVTISLHLFETFFSNGTHGIIETNNALTTNCGTSFALISI